MKKFLAFMAAALVVAVAPASSQPIDLRVKARIDRILKRTPLIDGHNDIAEALSDNHRMSVANLASGTDRWGKNPLMTDIARLRAGRVGGQFWSVYIDGTITGDAAIRATIERIDIVKRLIAAYPTDLQQAYTADDIVRIHRHQKIASLIGIEGGRQIGGSLAALRLFYELGARYMTLTHNQTTEWADSATDQPKFNGITPSGLQVIGEMNRLGMLVDLSHVSPQVMHRAINASRAPVIFSHSPAGGLVAHPRNVPDDVIRLLREKDGVVMVTIVPGFISKAVWDWSANRSGEEARLKAIHRSSQAAVDAGLKAWDAANPRPETDVRTVADHISHVAQVAGHEHVGLGGDYDGIPYTPTGLEGVETYPLIFAELIRRGWSDKELALLAGGNVLRVMRKAEAASRKMKDTAPLIDPIPGLRP